MDGYCSKHQRTEYLSHERILKTMERLVLTRNYVPLSLNTQVAFR